MVKRKKDTLSKTGSVDAVYSGIKKILEEARSNAYRAVNFAMVQAYWNIGQLIVEEEQRGRTRAKYGQYQLKELSMKLTTDFGKGFDQSNLRYMRLFYLRFPIRDALRHKSVSDKKSSALRGPSLPFNNSLRPELSWTHYRFLLKVEDENARNFYLNEAVEATWSTRQLERQINSFYYERILSSKDKKPVRKEAAQKAISAKPEDLIKDPYVLEFLNLKENRTLLEKNLEKELINKLQEFLLELGKGFYFIARQKRISVEDDHFYIDLVFYNYILKCFVLIDLKTGKLSHQDIGQMDFYVRYFEKEEKQPEDNPTIGLILCTNKNKTMVKYTLLENSKNIFASKYKLYLPSEEELKKELERELFELEKKLGD